jgi:hypothetical protein
MYSLSSSCNWKKCQGACESLEGEAPDKRMVTAWHRLGNHLLFKLLSYVCL